MSIAEKTKTLLTLDESTGPEPTQPPASPNISTEPNTLTGSDLFDTKDIPLVTKLIAEVAIEVENRILKVVSAKLNLPDDKALSFTDAEKQKSKQLLARILNEQLGKEMSPLTGLMLYQGFLIGSRYFEAQIYLQQNQPTEPPKEEPK